MQGRHNFGTERSRRNLNGCLNRHPPSAASSGPREAWPNQLATAAATEETPCLIEMPDLQDTAPIVGMRADRLGDIFKRIAALDEQLGVLQGIGPSAGGSAR